jgi:hypothetical protein
MLPPETQSFTGESYSIVFIEGREAENQNIRTTAFYRLVYKVKKPFSILTRLFLVAENGAFYVFTHINHEALLEYSLFMIC